MIYDLCHLATICREVNVQAYLVGICSLITTPPFVLIWSSDSETQMSQNLGTIIVETSQKISPIEDGGDQKEIDQTEDSYAQQREMQTCSHEDGRALKVC